MAIHMQVESLTKSFGERILFENITFGISEGQRIGLIAANGTGKTTLLNIIAGRLDYDSGEVVFRRDVTVGYLEQDPQFPAELTVLEACFHGQNEVVQIIAHYEQALAKNDTAALDGLLTKMESLGAWDFEQRAKQILTRLNITDLEQKVETLSGGQLKRVALAAALIVEPDLLILDEPTNHMDMRSKDILKRALMAYDGTVLVISHDREFLDGLVSKVYEFRDGRIKEHLGGIYDFLRARQIENMREIERAAPKTEAKHAPAKESQKPVPAPEKKQPELSYTEKKERDRKVTRLRNAVAKLEAEIAELEAKTSELDAQLMDPARYTMALFEEYNQLKTKLDTKMQEWTEATEKLEEYGIQ